ncbi:hypothetical protein H1230_09110 [Paenibacillus sp. 19GGS1-52]|uniref:hypothetical protein n=1 Tax=Paenibacillus sp. 19GGS1-52 TaxID=2758563 RepID=UPI001EFA9533|nr:hypothetical protein [Paenibacillus sp. 19GGS1-52]ULO08909.1 hypothetical protein H1230_09110 [Paenibacillus sp. 19GGS1-52]
MSDYNLSAARDEVTKTVRIYRALRAKGMLTPEVDAALRFREFELEQEIAEAKIKMTAGHGSHLINRKTNFVTAIIPELCGVFNKILN